MRLAAIAKNIKASGVCGVHYVGPLHEVWIMTAHGIYRLNGYPKPLDRDETAMMFGIGPKTMENIAYNDFTDEDATWLEGYNLTDSVEGISIHALREEGDSKNGEKHLRFCFIIKRSAQIWKSLSKNIRKKSRDLHRTA